LDRELVHGNDRYELKKVESLDHAMKKATQFKFAKARSTDTFFKKNPNGKFGKVNGGNLLKHVSAQRR
jgi:hypothetical protein